MLPLMFMQKEEMGQLLYIGDEALFDSTSFYLLDVVSWGDFVTYPGVFDRALRLFLRVFCQRG